MFYLELRFRRRGYPARFARHLCRGKPRVEDRLYACRRTDVGVCVPRLPRDNAGRDDYFHTVRGVEYREMLRLRSA